MADHRIYPMRLFATWDVDRTSSNSVPRLCFIAFNRLTVLRNVEPEITSLVVAVKLQGYKRTLRSNDICANIVNGIIDIDLDITFTLQYPHLIKKKSTNLYVMLQRRKKYKSRAILGFKTLAVGVLDLNQVLQSSSSVIRELNLYSENEKFAPTAKLYLSSASVQPVEQDDAKMKEQHVQYDTDDDDDDSSAQEDVSESEMVIDEASGAVTARRRHAPKSAKFAPRVVEHRRQKNLKQKFVALLRKFKISEEALETGGIVGTSEKPTQREIDALFEELENLSDSAPECDADALSVKSVPKPALRPYFNSTNTVHQQEKLDSGQQASDESKESGDTQTGNEMDTTDPELSDVAVGGTPNLGGQQSASGVQLHQTKSKELAPVPAMKQMGSLVHSFSDKKKRTDTKRQISAEYGAATTTPHEKTFLDKLSGHYVSMSTSKLRLPPPQNIQLINNNKEPLIHKPINEQLAMNFSAEDAAHISDAALVLVGASDVSAQNFVAHLREKSNYKVFVLNVLNDAKVFFNGLVNRFQRFCNVNSVYPQCVKVCPIGNDKFISFCLRAYVECFSPKPNEFSQFVRFFIISPPSSTIGRHLSSVDQSYSQMSLGWRDFWDKSELSLVELNEITNRLNKFLTNAKSVVTQPVAEIMLQLKEKGATDEDSTQIFIPFIGEIRIGLVDSYGDIFPDPGSTPITLQQVPGGSKNPQANQIVQMTASDFSPPGSPHLSEKGGEPISAKSHSLFSNLLDSQELQIEYWTMPHGISVMSASQAPASARPETGPSSGAIMSQQLQGVTTKKDSGAPSAAPMIAGSSPNSAALLSSPQQANILSNTSATKFSLKTAFRSLVVTKWPQSSTNQTFLTLNFVREKKRDKVLMKLGMKNKEKESEQKKHTIENVTRLICSTRQHTAMKLLVDGVEWEKVKFFQVSTQWQTHVKAVPLAHFNLDL